MRKNVRKTIAALLLSTVCLCSVAMPAFAASTTHKAQTDVTNNISSGDINIQIVEKMLDAGGGEVGYVNNRRVLPGQTVSKIVKVQNLAEPAWIRMKISYTTDAMDNWLSDDILHLADTTNWEKHGDYYYYKQIVPADGTVTFMTGFDVPAELDNPYEETQFDILLNAEAVQSKNFTPNWSAEDNDPWFGTVIEQCVHEAPYEPGVVTSEHFQIQYKNGTEGLIHVGDDFFANWANIMPGDTYSDEVEVRNDYQPAEIFFYTENIADDELLNALQLTIKNGDTVLYNGSLAGTASPTSLGEFMKGDTAKLTYSVTMPAQLLNKYSLKDTQTKWIFYADFPDSLPDPLPNAGGPGIAGIAAAGIALLVLGSTMIYIQTRKENRNNA